MAYLKYSIESISFIYIIDCILGMRNPQFYQIVDVGYEPIITIIFTFLQHT
jgi:hypothetical protein